MTTHIPTMTVRDVYKRLSELGMRTSEEKIRAMIDAGKYPFAISCRMEQREYEIYEVLFEQWIAERIEVVDENALFDWGDEKGA